MQRIRIALLIIVVASLVGCKHSTQDDPWPVWILYVYPKESIGLARTLVPVQGCPSVIWKYTGESHWNTETCYEGGSSVKVWNRISQQVNITYYVRCAGYRDSATNDAYFIPPAHQGQGREGAEVVVTKEIVLERQ